jgi:hypothetical protein
MVTVAAIRTTRKFARVAVHFTANPGHPKGRTGLVARWAQDRSLRIAGRNVGRLCRPHSFFSFTSGGRGSSRSLKGRVSAAKNLMNEGPARRILVLWDRSQQFRGL